MNKTLISGCLNPPQHYVILDLPIRPVIDLSDAFLGFMFQGAVSGSVQASDRLMKELREIYRSQSYKTGDSTDIFL